MESPIAAVLQEAVRLHRQGALTEAAARYEQVLQRDAGNADAQYYLATVRSQQGRLDEAMERAQRALVVDPRHARSHKLIGSLLSAAAARRMRWQASTEPSRANPILPTRTAHAATR